ncbi:Thiamin biosynthesis lipoprotein ApbE [Castellaniella defragrans 65Phen]|uniref:FAD:protein FMN transferase n=1 Tax=Castellaniella defragrans (strain DSM 12143 / CCUG 39792 / 65Phen) TaxID=1437824 RepID=W8X9L5_CASD6|nr:Thiamin biosynthesis lipoprotein ApbE [Castellaniella defragrans 65Phen]
MPKTYSDPAAAAPAVRPAAARGAAPPARPAPTAFSESTLSGPAMGTRWSARYQAQPDFDHGALSRGLARVVESVDAQMSPWKPDSDLMRLNRAEPGHWVTLPEAVLEVLARALDIGTLSGGAYDVAVGGLVDAWGFGAAADTPDPAAIRHAAADHRPAHLWLDLDREQGRARKRAPLTLDLCGIAKGYAVDRMAQVMALHGVGHALVGLDGELRACGARANGRPWAVALESPQEGRRAAHGVIELADLSVATSGDYRRWVRIGGERLAHTMDGRRAAPVRNPVASVTVLAAECMDADAWATALLVAGPDEGPALARRMGLDALFLLRRGGRLVEFGLGRFAS